MSISPAPHTRLITWFSGEAVLAKLADGNGRRLAEQVRDHPLGPHAAGDVQHRGGHLDTRRRHRKLSAAIAFLLADAPENGQRFTTSGVVVIDVRDLGALCGPLVLDVLHRCRRLRPIRGGYREDVRKTLAVRRIGAPEARRQTRNLVFHVPRRQRVDDRRAVIHRRHAAFALDAFVSLDAAIDLVGVLHLDVAHRMPVDAALLVDQLDVVVGAGAQQRADELRRAGAVALAAHDDLIGAGRRQPSGAEQQCQHTHDTRAIS